MDLILAKLIGEDSLAERFFIRSAGLVDILIRKAGIGIHCRISL